MEVKEAAACGISQRLFNIEFGEDEIVDIYRILNYAQNEIGFYDEDFLEDLISQMYFIIGSGIEGEISEQVEDSIHWEDAQGFYTLVFFEPEAAVLFRILNGVKRPGEGFDKNVNQRMLDQLMELAPLKLSNLPIINR